MILRKKKLYKKENSLFRLEKTEAKVKASRGFKLLNRNFSASGFSRNTLINSDISFLFFLFLLCFAVILTWFLELFILGFMFGCGFVWLTDVLGTEVA